MRKDQIVVNAKQFQRGYLIAMGLQTPESFEDWCKDLDYLGTLKYDQPDLYHKYVSERSRRSRLIAKLNKALGIKKYSEFEPHDIPDSVYNNYTYDDVKEDF